MTNEKIENLKILNMKNIKLILILIQAHDVLRDKLQRYR